MFPFSLDSTSEMSKPVKSVKWDALLKAPYTRSFSEESKFIQVYVKEKKTNNDVIMRAIYEEIKNDSNTNANLIKLYHEALFGNDKVVLKRIRDHMSAFKREYK